MKDETVPHPTLYRLRYDDGRPDVLLTREDLQSQLEVRQRAGLDTEGFDWDAWDVLEVPGGAITCAGITYISPDPTLLRRGAEPALDLDLER